MWGDYNNDGWPDLFVAIKNDTGAQQANHLFRNNRDGTFSQIIEGPIVTDNDYSVGETWVDYDNDGYLDLFVVNGDLSAASNALYHNNRDGTFTRMSAQEVGSIVGDLGHFASSTWGDYDNDGYIDAFVSAVNGEGGYLYHNDRNGGFSRVLSGGPADDKGNAFGCAWGDYDNDGFLDLFVARGAHDKATNLLYRNNGNSNTWLKVKLVGTVSNRSAIGATQLDWLHLRFGCFHRPEILDLDSNEYPHQPLAGVRRSGCWKRCSAVLPCSRPAALNEYSTKTLFSCI